MMLPSFSNPTPVVDDFGGNNESHRDKKQKNITTEDILSEMKAMEERQTERMNKAEEREIKRVNNILSEMKNTEERQTERLNAAEERQMERLTKLQKKIVVEKDKNEIEEGKKEKENGMDAAAN